ncbi:MAG TPA: hypothetical protein VMD30_11985 [Tepidisphaeraceae bacterium]|nr:hypothetical protein [Tepidisphaeraceae bacterium]
MLVEKPREMNICATTCRFFAAIVLIAAPCVYAQAQSQWAHEGPDGRLVYRSAPDGDHIMDFSYAGYMGGGVALPNVPVKLTVHPSGAADDTASIQAAIDKVSALPLVGKFRGAVLLQPGVYKCDQTIFISADGVVLRGSGDQEGNSSSTILMSGKPHVAIAVQRSRGEGGRPSDEADATTLPAGAVRTLIADRYVPSGSMSFHVADASGFAPGDFVVIRRPVTQRWVDFMHMDDLVRNGRRETWLAVPSFLITQRQISAIVGNTITLDAPVTDSLDSRFDDPPGAMLVETPAPMEPSQVGIEFLRIQCPPQRFNHTRPHFSAIRMQAQDSWIRDTYAQDTMGSVAVEGRRITLLRVAVVRTVPHIGASRPAEFAPNATEVLMDRCSVKADNIWFSATGKGESGPIVLLNCEFRGDGDAESHQRWSTGILYDNCVVKGGGIALRDRGEMGSGHGWTMGWGVVWNCRASDFIVQNPPGTLNWLIGSIGAVELAPQPFGRGPDLPQGTIDSPDRPVTPRSLYLAQLAERLGPRALRNIGY